ncbi:hypothetical protein [Phytoactinopolyspora mesophila]|uniref:Uncharacterized protein n=1 Tax=Phytoactinopolyspora mesophila TaxID=2650750 RepID=A0A7K3MC09_9ACTN|nr:hypothetical protein [Phytoactinopolyspora mesophila]NDL60806.1 hypothetical protein [Phytoactinopolyspora mesophila]
MLQLTELSGAPLRAPQGAVHDEPLGAGTRLRATFHRRLNTSGDFTIDAFTTRALKRPSQRGLGRG